RRRLGIQARAVEAHLDAAAEEGRPAQNQVPRDAPYERDVAVAGRRQRQDRLPAAGPRADRDHPEVLRPLPARRPEPRREGRADPLHYGCGGARPEWPPDGPQRRLTRPRGETQSPRKLLPARALCLATRPGFEPGQRDPKSRPVASDTRGG